MSKKAGTDQPTSEIVIHAAYKKALSARENAHAPYSKCLVGAALINADGEIFTGCNVENASYGASICAERGAIAGAVAQGETHFTDCIVVTDANDPWTPCGICRQVLYEFNPDMQIIMGNTQKLVRRLALKNLLPDAFSSDHLN